MKGFNEGLKPAMSYEQAVATLGSRLTLPAGWKFRDKVLEQDLVLIPETGTARIMPDNPFNVYDITGPGYSNYKPWLGFLGASLRNARFTSVNR